MLCEKSIGSKSPPPPPHLSGSQPAHINTCKYTLIQTATCRHRQTHTSKELQEGRGRSHHANRCRSLGRAWHQKRNEKKGWRRAIKKKKRGRGGKGTGLGGSSHVFSKAFLFLTLAGSSSRSPDRGDRACDMLSDAAKVNKRSIWPLG